MTEVAGRTVRQESLDELLNEIRKSEQKLSNLRVEAELVYSDWDASRLDWQYVGETRVTAWYVGHPGGKARIDIHKMISPWRDGPTPFIQRSLAVAYDGKLGQQLLLEDGPPDNITKTLEGEITQQRSPVYIGANGFVTGWWSSLYGCRDQIKMRLSEYLEAAAKTAEMTQSVQCSVAPIRFANADCIKVLVEIRPAAGESQREAWYLDPSRGHAILYYEDSVWGSQTTVEQLLEPAPGIFYPSKVTRLATDASGRPVAKWSYRTSSVIVNDPNFRDDIFTMQWPVGTVVHDKISGITFTVGQSASDVDKAIADQVKRLKAAVRHPLTPQVKQSGGYWIPARWLAAIAVAAVAVAWLGWWARKQRK